MDVQNRIVAGGGEYHADCEQVLLDDDSQSVNIWGADWDPVKKKVKFGSYINIRPKRNNRGMEIEHPELRATIEQIIRQRLELP